MRTSQGVWKWRERGRKLRQEDWSIDEEEREGVEELCFALKGSSSCCSGSSASSLINRTGNSFSPLNHCKCTGIMTDPGIGGETSYWSLFSFFLVFLHHLLIMMMMIISVMHKKRLIITALSLFLLPVSFLLIYRPLFQYKEFKGTLTLKVKNTSFKELQA